MAQPLFVFEDGAYRRFLPLAHTRPVYELLCGAMTLRERIERSLGGEAHLLCRPYLSDVIAERCGRRTNDVRVRGGGSVLMVNGRLLDPEALLPALADTAGATSWWNGGQLVAARLDAADARDLLLTVASNDFIVEPAMLGRMGSHMTPASLISYPWELIERNDRRIIADLSDWQPPSTRFLSRGVHVFGNHNPVVTPGARVDPGAALDTTEGPIVLGPGVHVSSHTLIEGPCVVGAGSRIAGGRLRAGTTIGPHCRIGGEIEASIFQGYSNKVHEGFIGHAYVGEWVNLGALTTNSDLKNTYGPVKIWNDGRLLETGIHKLGGLIGDHVKTGIGTLLDTGTVIGVAANLFGGGLARAKWVPSFSWGNPPQLELYDPERCKSTMEKVMKRRDVRMSEAYAEMIDALFEMTDGERSFGGAVTGT